MYRRFLPSLDLKRQQLLGAHKEAQAQLANLEKDIEEFQQTLENLLPSLGSSTINPDKLGKLVRVRDVVLGEENVVGAHIPVVREIKIEQARILNADSTVLGRQVG